MYIFIMIVPSGANAADTGDYLRALAPVVEEPSGRCRIQSENGMMDGWMAITKSNDIAADYEPEDLEKIFSEVKDPAFYLIESRDKKTNFANQFILSLDSSVPAIIDNNHGCRESIAYMKKLISSGIDWRYYSPEESNG